jgi:hypothetical protein
MRRKADEPKWARLFAVITVTAFAVAFLFYWLET